MVSIIIIVKIMIKKILNYFFFLREKTMIIEITKWLLICCTKLKIFNGLEIFTFN